MDLKTKGRKLFNPHAIGMFYRCQRKVDGDLFKLNYSINQLFLTLYVIQVLDGWNYFQSC